MTFLKSYNVEEIICGFKKIWGERYIYDRFTLGKNKFKCDIYVGCRIHGYFATRLQRHLKSGCPECSKIRKTRKLKKGRKYNKELFLKKINNVHNHRYEYDLKDFKSSSSIITIVCKKHGIFTQKGQRHLQGDGCPTCGIDFTNYKNKKTFDQFVKEANVVHNCKYTYQSYEGHDMLINISCPVHGVFEQKPREHLKGSGCQKCSSRISKISQNWLDYLKVYDREVYLKDVKMTPDGYNEETKTVYLFHGDYWHGNPDVYNHDDINPSCKVTYGKLYEKTKESEIKYKDNGYNVITIWEKDWNQK